MLSTSMTLPKAQLTECAVKIAVKQIPGALSAPTAFC
jgi:hypothetical protein